MAVLQLKGWGGSPSGRDLVGLDLDKDHLKIVHVRMAGMRREVAGLASFEIRESSDEEICGHIRKTVADWHLQSPRCFIAVPMYPVITRSIEVPSRDPHEIREIVNLQASRHTPYARNEIIVDLITLGTVRDNYSKVLIVIIPREVVDRQTRIVEAAGLRVEQAFFAPEGIAQACARILQTEAGKYVALVHMDSWFTSFLVAQGDHVLFVRGISVGANHLLDEKEIYRERFVDELQKSMEAYLTEEAGPPLSFFLLTGVAAETHDLDDLFGGSQRLPIKHQTYFDYFAISPSARQLAEASHRISFFNVIAPLLLYDRMRLDLVSEQTRQRRQLVQRGREMMKTGMWVVVLVGLGLSLLVSKIYFKSAFLNYLVSRYQPVKEEAKNLEQAYDQALVIKRHLTGRGTSLEVLAQLYDTLPLEVRAMDIRYEDGSRLAVKGTSRTMGAIFAFVSQLEKSDAFKSVKTKYVTTRSEAGEDWADFEVHAELENVSGVNA